MKTKSFICLLTIIFFICSFMQNANSKTYTKDDVVKLIGTIEKQLTEIKKSNLNQNIEEEINNIEFCIKNSKKFLSEGNLQIAYLQISIGIAYFQKIEAKIELYYSKKVLEQTEKRLKQ